MKRITLTFLAVVAILAGCLSCSRINDIDERLTDVENSLSKLEAQIAAGAFITSVDQTEDGCTFTLSNGQTYKVTNGKDGESVIADVKIEDNYVVITLNDGEIMRLPYQNPLSMVTLNIVPDYDDGTVCEPETIEASGITHTSFYLDIAVTPAKYAEILADAVKFIHKAVFSPVQTKSGFDKAFTVSPKSVTYDKDASVPFLEAYFNIDGEMATLLANTAYTVSYTIEDKDGVHGTATAFVAISYGKHSGDYSTDPEGVLPGKFSVAEGKLVQFSKGNLWADGENSLHFEDNQWGFNSNYETSHVSHFTWSDNVASAVGTTNNGSYLFCDESHKVSVDGSDAIYYALSTTEWRYLFSNHSRKWVTVNGVNGYVIAPDGVSLSDVTTSYSEDELKKDNLVFLPAAGFRDGSDLNQVGDRGRYWSSSESDGGFAYRMYFDSGSVSHSDSGVRENGYSVRLVTNCE